MDLCQSHRFKIFYTVSSWLFFASLVTLHGIRAAGFALAALCIFTRSFFVVAELSNGLQAIWCNEVFFMVLVGAMIVVASFALTLLHPRDRFKRQWAKVSFLFWLGNLGTES